MSKNKCYKHKSNPAMATRILKASNTSSTTNSVPSPLSILGLHFFSTKPIQSAYRKQISLANLLQRYGFPPSHLHNFLSRNHSLLNSNLQDIERSLALLTSFKIPQKSLVSLVAECPGVLELEFLRKWEMGFSKEANFGVSPLVMRSVLEHSRRFQIDPDRFSESLKGLKGLGFSEATVKKVLEGFPRVIAMKVSEIHRKVEFLKEIGFSMEESDFVLYSFPEVLGLGVESRLMLLLAEFENLGFSKEMVRKEVVREPRILSMEIGELSRCMELLRTLKCREPIKLKIFGGGMFRAGFDVKLRVDCLCQYGLIRREAFTVLWKEPRVIIYNIDEIEKKIEYLLNTMRLNVGCLVEVPEFLGVSFEKQIVPRYNVIEYLRSKGGLGDEVGLKGMTKLSRLRFYNLYVKPYPECERMFGRLAGDVQVKRRNPMGLWKLFKAQRDPDSKEDVQNVKSFMEGIV